MTPVSIRLAPDLAGFEFPDRSYAEVAGLPMLLLFDRPISGWSQLVKAIEDRVLAALFLLVFSAVLILTSLAVRVTSRGSVLFKQKRYGFNNQLIEIWKFRTMYHDLSDHQADRLVTKDDERVTPIGRFLRRTSIDELPQLFNVLRGDMSIVGPRPHPVSAKAGGQLYYEVVDQYAARHKVKPGITGWAQVNGWRGETSTAEDIEKRVEHDLYYIDNWSIWLDFLIIARTIMVLLGDEKAY
jgi:exopolysaccharide biosynthesis polyprenyl glycosylphosphotransferase